STPAPSWLEAIAAASLTLLSRAPLPPLWTGWSSSPSIDTLAPIEIGGVVRRWRLAGSRESLDASCAQSTCRIAALSQRPDDGARCLSRQRATLRRARDRAARRRVGRSRLVPARAVRQGGRRRLDRPRLSRAPRRHARADGLAPHRDRGSRARRQRRPAGEPV